MKENILKIGKNCCGCHSCEMTCPVQAVSFQEDEEGFLYPVVSDACINCGKCLKVCPIVEQPAMETPVFGYAAHLRDRERLRKSSSGGIFMATAEEILRRGGVVFGCAEAIPGSPAHRAVDNSKELSQLQGSKYAQSEMTGVYKAVVEQLQQGKIVLFTGTPCQVAGLLRITGPCESLYTVDIICHGVPSRKIYRAYLTWLEKKTGAKVRSFRFRSKEKHDWSLTYRVELEQNGKLKAQEKIASLSPYYSHFLKGMDYRESCYCCPYACKNRVSDLTIGDFWGIERVAPESFNPDGVSAVLVNTEKGKSLWEAMAHALAYKEVPVEQIVQNNGQLKAPTKRAMQREFIYLLLNQKGYDAVAHAYSNRKELLIDGLKDMIPNRIRQRIKMAIKKVR